MIQRQITQRTQPEDKEVEDEEGRHREFNVDNTADGTLIEAEDRAVNAISLSVYKEYIVLGSGRFSPWIVVPVLLTLLFWRHFVKYSLILGYLSGPVINLINQIKFILGFILCLHFIIYNFDIGIYCFGLYHQYRSCDVECYGCEKFYMLCHLWILPLWGEF